jgi:anti-anti-sigma factor
MMGMFNNDIVPGFDDERDDTLKINLQEAPGLEDCLVLILNGYIDTYNSNYFQKRIQKAIDAGFFRLIFNCNGLNYVSSTGIGSFTSFLKAVKPQGGDLILLEVQPKVYEVFQLLGFSQFFNIYDSLEEALVYFRDEANKVQPTIVEVFPVVFSCPICSKKLQATKSGRFRCSECKTILEVDSAGIISLG